MIDFYSINKQNAAPIVMKTQPNFFCYSVKLIEYSVSAVIVVSFHKSVETLTCINISLFLLSVCTEGLLSTTNIMAFLQNPLPIDNEKLSRTSNPIPHPE